MGIQPVIIQGGMGAGVSNWRLANAVSKQGQLGVVSGTALDEILARRLQDGDPGGHMRRGLDHFPFPEMAERIWREYYIPGGKAATASYKKTPMLVKDNPRHLQELCLAGNFVEVWLAREGHNNPVGINYLEKIQTALLSAIYGAMLGGVGYVLIGAGIPVKIPGVLDALAKHEPATYNLQVAGVQDGDDTTMRFDPREFMERELSPLERPKFLAIVASNILAATLLKKSNGKVDGLIIEHHTAGGHNAPPRGKLQLNERGEAVYGERDEVDLAAIRNLGVPFWLAGGYGSHEKLVEAQSAGATGVQVGTAFAYTTESGLRDDYKQALLQMARDGETKVFTDPNSSPTGFPFKAALLANTYSEDETYLERPRICDLGYLREAYRTPEGTISFRCASEPVPVYISHGGDPDKAAGKRCLCNALLANIGYPQVRAGGKYEERGLITSGNALVDIKDFQPADGTLAYSAADVIGKLLNG
jgi:nitronate monooxygenase